MIGAALLARRRSHERPAIIRTPSSAGEGLA